MKIWFDFKVALSIINSIRFDSILSSAREWKVQISSRLTRLGNWQLCVCVRVCLSVCLCLGVAFCNLSIGALWWAVYRRTVHVNQYQSVDKLMMHFIITIYSYISWYDQPVPFSAPQSTNDMHVSFGHYILCVCVFCFALLTLNLWMKMFNVSKTLCCTSCAKLLDLEMGT